MKLKFRNKTVFTIAGIVSISVVVFLFVLYEVKEGKNDLLKILEEESVTLIESLSNNIENSIITNFEIENMIVKSLNSVAELASHLEGHDDNDSEYLHEIADEFEISHISLIEPDGRIIASNSDISIDAQYLPTDFLAELDPLMKGERIWLYFGNTQKPIGEGRIYLIARKRKVKQGCVLIGLGSDKLLEIRKKFGIGKLIQDIGKNPNIVYAALQDDQGILAASRGISDLESINGQAFLSEAWETDEINTRITDYLTIDSNERKVFEVVKTINLDESSKMMVRIALSTESVRAIQQKSMQRAILIGVGAILLGSLFIVIIFIRKKFFKLEEEHQLAQSYISLILNSVTDAVLALDSKGEITVFNLAAESIFEMNASKLIGKSYSEYFPEDDLRINREQSNIDLPNYVELIFRTKSGKKKILGISLSVIRKNSKDKPGENPDEIETTFIIIRDLTKAKQTAEQLQRKDKLTAMGELANGVAHEIRNPLNAINIIAQRFQHEFEPQEDKEDYYKLVKVVRSEVKRVNNIIKQFMEFSTPSKLDLQKASITELLDEIIILVESQATESGISIERSIPNDIVCMLDKEKMQQVFLNIMRNSIEAMESGGLLKCSAEVSDDDIIIEISDTGIGIESKDKDKIFNLYYTSKQSGTGMGLSIVHQIITEHKGEIIVESESGKGTTMKILLPLEF